MSRVTSFKNAFEGLAAAVKLETNIKIHLFLAFLVVILAILLQISLSDWVKVIILIGLVISLELTNTAIEAVVDAFTSQHHEGAKLAKDISAGAVLVAAITAAIAGILIFLPYLY
jgi:undecaprenol kinase